MKNTEYSSSEKSIILIGIKCNKKLEEINQLLISEQKRLSLGQVPISAANFVLIKFKMIPKMSDQEVWEYIKDN